MPLDMVQTSQKPLIKYEGRNLKQVYLLTDELNVDPTQVELVQALTLNDQKPFMGLKGTYGLFASSEWWNNINQRKLPLKFISGVVISVYETGQDRTGVKNTLELKNTDGEIVIVGIYVNDKSDVALFIPGAQVELVYALDELKYQPDLGDTVAYSEIALEMAVSK
jgi:hypothetical protein